MQDWTMLCNATNLHDKEAYDHVHAIDVDTRIVPGYTNMYACRLVGTAVKT